jgi:hypothetical protein
MPNSQEKVWAQLKRARAQLTQAFKMEFNLESDRIARSRRLAQDPSYSPSSHEFERDPLGDRIQKVITILDGIEEGVWNGGREE